MKDVFKQNIDATTRDLARQRLTTAYLQALGLIKKYDPEKAAPPEPEVPAQVKKHVDDIEKLWYEKFSTDPRAYIGQLAKLSAFLNQYHYIGQFSHLFRSKFIQLVYTPQRLIDLDIIDMLPEVFLNYKASPADKLSIYQSITGFISERIDDIGDSFNNILNPTATIKPKQKPTVISRHAEKLLVSSQQNVNDLCENPYWTMKKVNMIICKENGKFYCLDTERLLAELAKQNTASNYFTDKPLSSEITENLRARYGKEIAQLKDGESVEVGSRSIGEIVDLEKTVKNLQEFKKVLAKKKVKQMLELGFDLQDAMDAKDYDKIPAMIREEFNKESDGKEALKKMNQWLDANIADINTIIAGIKGEKVEPSAIEEEFVFELDEDEEPKVTIVTEETIEEEIPVAPRVKAREAELKLIKDKILTENSVALAIYNDELENVEAMRDAFIGLLDKTSNPSDRIDLNENLKEANNVIKIIRERGRTLNGILEMLAGALQEQLAEQEKMAPVTGMGMLYQQEQAAVNIEELQAMQDFIDQIQKEMVYIQGIKDKFVAEQQKLGNI